MGGGPTSQHDADKEASIPKDPPGDLEMAGGGGLRLQGGQAPGRLKSLCLLGSSSHGHPGPPLPRRPSQGDLSGWGGWPEPSAPAASVVPCPPQQLGLGPKEQSGRKGGEYRGSSSLATRLALFHSSPSMKASMASLIRSRLRYSSAAWGGEGEPGSTAGLRGNTRRPRVGVPHGALDWKQGGQPPSLPPPHPVQKCLLPH